jgi:hypothetical protein
MNFDEVITQAARELGIEQYVSVSPYLDGESNTVAVVTYEGKTVPKGIAPFTFLDISKVKMTLLQMMEDAKVN